MASKNARSLLCDDDFVLDELLVLLRRDAVVSAPELIDHFDSYLDTRSRSLADAGLAARCRRRGRRRSIDIEPVPIVPALVRQHEELSEAVPAGQDPARVLEHMIAQRFPLRLRGAAIEQLVLRTWRKRILVERQGCQAELRIDSVDVRRPGQRRGIPFGEVELEQLSGSPAVFEQLATTVASLPSLLPSGQSKYLRALSLLGLPGYSYGPAAPTFGPDETIDAAARAICLTQLQIVRAYEPGTRVGLDTEHLHKMRVATRRLRAALNTFGACFDQRNRDFLARNFKWLAALLGEVRDLDVHQLDVPRWRQELGEQPSEGWMMLEQVLLRRWQETRERLRTGLDSTRYGKLLERAEAAFSRTPRRPQGHPGNAPVASLAALATAKRCRQFGKALRACERNPQPEAIHQLRIIGKKLRYTAEFFRPLFSDQFRKRLKKLSVFQDQLGLFQDAVVAGELAVRLRNEALSQGADAPYLHVLGLLVGSSAAGARFGRHQVELALGPLGGRKVLGLLSGEAQQLGTRAATAMQES